MWNRKDLKQRAKSSFAKNRWPAILVAMILGVIVGDISINFNTFDAFSVNFPTNNDLSDYYSSIINTSLLQNLLTVFGFSILIVSILSFLINLFVFYPLSVGCQRWFIISRTNENTPISEILYPFHKGYGNVILVLFLKQLFTGLWTLLFIIPGIIKYYEYRMIPYLLAENPDMAYDEAFARSKELMQGNKFDAFILDLSFIGWTIAGIFTLQLVTIFYVAPYRAYTNMELYVALCNSKFSQNGPQNGFDFNSYDQNDFNQNDFNQQ